MPSVCSNYTYTIAPISSAVNLFLIFFQKKARAIGRGHVRPGLTVLEEREGVLCPTTLGMQLLTAVLPCNWDEGGPSCNCVAEHEGYALRITVFSAIASHLSGNALAKSATLSTVRNDSSLRRFLLTSTKSMISSLTSSSIL